jgi:hypothetical protein
MLTFIYSFMPSWTASYDTKQDWNKVWWSHKFFWFPLSSKLSHSLIHVTIR